MLRGGLSGWGGSSAVTIDMFAMKSGNARHHAKWSFPYPGATPMSLDYFVGENTAQTLSNKKFTTLSGDGTAPAVRKENAAGDGVIPVLGAGSNKVAGLITVTTGPTGLVIGAIVNLNLGGSSAIPAFVTLTAANQVSAQTSTSIYVTGATANEFYVGTTVALQANTKYQWYYHVIT